MIVLFIFALSFGSPAFWALFDHVSKKNVGLPSDNAKFDNAFDIFFENMFFSDLAHLGKL